MANIWQPFHLLDMNKIDKVKDLGLSAFFKNEL